ncbi:unnamed protein product [Albugo candida]|uniref:Uncharacterized protein n=1 Tax=Albugo candida TaxID=65357 RepID=A0A024GP85_9STRA|nr:unnamed protein product [Albugo candida]|eukprot:CCI48342.1 unnamed protein product [Albugo candida]
MALWARNEAVTYKSLIRCRKKTNIECLNVELTTSPLFAATLRRFILYMGIYRSAPSCVTEIRVDILYCRYRGSNIDEEVLELVYYWQKARCIFHTWKMQSGRYLDKRRVSSHALQYALGWEKSACEAHLFKLIANIWIRWCKHISVFLFLGLSNYIVQQILKSESLTDVDSRCTSCGLVQSLIPRFSIELETYTLWNCDVMFKDITQSCMKIIQSRADSITYGVRYQESGGGEHESEFWSHCCRVLCTTVVNTLHSN